jgi:hypothetical protein
MGTDYACSPSAWSADDSSGRTEGTVSLTRAQLPVLLEGIDWRRPVRTAEAAIGDLL